MEAAKIVLICCTVLSTQMIPRIREKKLPYRGSVEMVQHLRSIKDYADLFLGIKHQNDS